MAIPRAQTEAAQKEFFGDVIPFKANAGAAISPDCNAAETQIFTLGANATINAPVSSWQPPVAGMTMAFVLIQDATGSRSVAWNAIYRDVPLLTAGAPGTQATLEFRYDGASWQCVGGSAAFA